MLTNWVRKNKFFRRFELLVLSLGEMRERKERATVDGIMVTICQKAQHPTSVNANSMTWRFKDRSFLKEVTSSDVWCVCFLVFMPSFTWALCAVWYRYATKNLNEKVLKNQTLYFISNWLFWGFWAFRQSKNIEKFNYTSAMFRWVGRMRTMLVHNNYPSDLNKKINKLSKKIKYFNL